MIITKRALPRRTVLRGLGAAVSLPLLDAMVPALSAMTTTAVDPIRRLGFLYVPNGVAMTDAVNHWTPDGVGTDFTLSPILKPLESLQEHVVVVSGLSHKEADSKGDGNGDHTRGSAAWLNGIRPKHTEGADVRAGTTADQIAAAALGQDTQLPSVEIGLDPNYMVGNCEGGYSCIYMNTLAWRTPTTPLPAEVNPRVVFERLFGEGGTPAQRVARARQTRSVLDAVLEQMTRLQQTLGPADRVKASDYFDAVREIERRIQHTEEQGGAAVLPELERPIGIPDTYAEHAALMFELQRLAFQADITRVFTFMMGRETSPRTFPGDRRLGAPSWSVAPRQQRGADREVHAGEHLPGAAVRVVPGSTTGNAGRRRYPAGQHVVTLRGRAQQRERTFSHQPATRPGRRSGRATRRWSSPRVSDRHPDGEPPAQRPGEGRGGGGAAR